MLSSTDSNNKLKTWSTEFGPFSIASVITGQSLLDDELSREIYRSLGPGQGGVDVALNIGFFCDLGAAPRLSFAGCLRIGDAAQRPSREFSSLSRPRPRLLLCRRLPTDRSMRHCGLRQSNPDTEAAPFAAFRLDTTGTRTGGALVTETDMIDPTTRLLRNMTGLRLRLAITGESRESDLYTTVFNLGTILWVTFISQWVAEIVLLNFNPRKKYYEEAVYRRACIQSLEMRRRLSPCLS